MLSRNARPDLAIEGLQRRCKPRSETQLKMTENDRILAHPCAILGILRKDSVSFLRKIEEFGHFHIRLTIRWCEDISDSFKGENTEG